MWMLGWKREWGSDNRELAVNRNGGCDMSGKTEDNVLSLLFIILAPG
jgi:hypothetical protein